MLAVAVAPAVWNLRPGRFTEALLMIVWAHGGLLANRNIPIFMIVAAPPVAAAIQQRSEEHTSELQSLRHLVCRLLLEKINIGGRWAGGRWWGFRRSPAPRCAAPS